MGDRDTTTTEATTSPLDLDALERLAAAATPGPWEAVDIGAGTVAWGVASPGEIVVMHDFVSGRDAAFIAAARAALGRTP